MVGGLSRILPIRSAKKKQNGWKMENLPSTSRRFDEIIAKQMTGTVEDGNASATRATSASLDGSHETMCEKEAVSSESLVDHIVDEKEPIRSLNADKKRIQPPGGGLEATEEDAADEASLHVWGAYQRWRVTKIRLGGILLNQEVTRPDSSLTFPLVNSVYSSVLGTPT